MNRGASLFAAAALGVLTLSAAAAPDAGRPAVERLADVRFTPAQTDLLVRTLAGADAHGLDPARFLDPDLRVRLAAADPAQREAARQTLLASVLDYARTVRSGALPRAAFPKEWAQRPQPFDPAAGLADAVAANQLAEWLAALPPPDPHYAELRQALARYRSYAATGGWKRLPSGPALRSGGRDPRVPLLRDRLAAEGDASAAGPSDIFDTGLAAALARYQRLHALAADGALGAQTLAALNIPAAARVAQIVANMERLRWAPRLPPATRIEVDTASATLSFYRSGVLTLSMRTIVGRPADPSPMFGDQVEAVVLNPPWNVPVTIAVREILPKARRDAAYLARNDFVIRPGEGPMEARLQQRAGPKSALGLYKFDMPNGFNVYLHDTPARSLFDGDRRNLSHGCIRLQKPRELAELVLGDDQGMSPEAIALALREGATRRIELRRPIPVFVSHWTVLAAGGEVAFRPDVYGWDAKLAALLVR